MRLKNRQTLWHTVKIWQNAACCRIWRPHQTARVCFKAPKHWAIGEKRGQQRSLACMWMGMERKSRLCICMFVDELEGLRSLSPVWITNPHQGRGKGMDREEQEETDSRLLSKCSGGVWCCGFRADVPNWQRKEKKTKGIGGSRA